MLRCSTFISQLQQMVCLIRNCDEAIRGTVLVHIPMVAAYGSPADGGGR
jgi:hypothetical protein